MAGSDRDDETEKSLPAKRIRRSGKGSRSNKNQTKKGVHDISDYSSGDEPGLEKEKPVGGGGFSTQQMKEFTTMISAVMGKVFAQVAGAHVFGQMLLPPNSSKDGGTQSANQMISIVREKFTYGAGRGG